MYYAALGEDAIVYVVEVDDVGGREREVLRLYTYADPSGAPLGWQRRGYHDALCGSEGFGRIS